MSQNLFCLLVHKTEGIAKGTLTQTWGMETPRGIPAQMLEPCGLRMAHLSKSNSAHRYSNERSKTFQSDENVKLTAPPEGETLLQETPGY